MKNLKVSLAGVLAVSSLVCARAQNPADEPIAQVVISASRSEQLREQAAVVVERQQLEAQGLLAPVRHPMWVAQVGLAQPQAFRVRL